ncbi:MAG: lysophospholipid acyltransferase family protein [Flavobacteriaceae bacterium]|nr:lysophospholipid acyltransferase family protein [Flavobacteriaceae bacterium]
MKKAGKKIFVLLSGLPFSVLYGVSDILYFIIYYLVGYRKRIVRENLLIVFPDKTERERKRIEKEFYKNFSDFMIELVKTFSMKEEDYNNRIRFTHMDICQQYVNEGRDVVLLIGHMFNWEWLTGISAGLPQKNTYAIYKKVVNNFFDQGIHESRSRFGTIPLTVREVVRTMLRLPNDGSHVFLFVADQRPFKKRIHYELEFFNRMTPAFNGYDKIIRKKDYAVVYVDMVKIARGRYEAQLKRILPDGKKFRENEIVEKFYKELTQNIKTHPGIWLWSHKRWKYTSGIDYRL